VYIPICAYFYEPVILRALVASLEQSLLKRSFLSFDGLKVFIMLMYSVFNWIYILNQMLLQQNCHVFVLFSFVVYMNECVEIHEPDT